MDLHGATVEEAETRIEEFLDRAYYRGLVVVEIVHGKGTGRLRAAVDRICRDHPMVERVARDGNPGATRVYLAR